jgi:AcrR family transcriptional regulator
MELFSEGDYYQTTSKDIARAAGVSIGSFYTYFNNKKEVIIEILNYYYSDAITDTEEMFSAGFEDTLEMRQALKSVVGRYFELHDFPIGFYKNITMLSISDEEIGLIFKNYEESMINMIKNLILSYASDIPMTQLNAAGIITFSAVKGSIHSIKFSESQVDEIELIDELVKFLHSYILSIGVTANSNK